MIVRNAWSLALLAGGSALLLGASIGALFAISPLGSLPGARFLLLVALCAAAWFVDSTVRALRAKPKGGA